MIYKDNNTIVFNKTYTAANRANDMSYDGRGNLMQGDGFTQVWDNRNRLVESRVTATNALLGGYVYNERGLRVKAERNAQPMVQVVAPNGGESLYLGAPYTITWSSTGPSGTVKLELLVGGSVTGTITENLPGTQTSYQWQVGQILSGWVNPGADFKVRVTTVVPPVTETIYYFYDNGGKLLSEYDQTGCVKDYLYLGGKMIGEYLPASNSYYYYASDQINSTRIVTDASGAVVHSAQYDPYGGLYKTWVDTYHPKPGFSGKEREAGSEMDYFGARYYGHKQYTFMSVDPVISKEKAIANPQLWNMYAYCRTNPTNYLDPDGESSFKVNYTVQYVPFSTLGFNFGHVYIDQNANNSLHVSISKFIDNQINIDASLDATVQILNPNNVSWYIFGVLKLFDNPQKTMQHEIGHIKDIENYVTPLLNKMEQLINKGEISSDDKFVKTAIVLMLKGATTQSKQKRDKKTPFIDLLYKKND